MKELTLQDLKDMKPGVFAKGESVDTPDGCNMTGSGVMLRWVASRGDVHDWCIYILEAWHDWQVVKDVGDKVCMEENIRKLVPCTDDAFAMYRY
jgi:hypothetical protein